MDYYIKVNKQGIIKDIITSPFRGYIKIELDENDDTVLNGGWHRYDNGVITEIPELNPRNIETVKQVAKNELLIELLERGLL